MAEGEESKTRDRHVTPRRTLAVPPDEYDRLEALRAARGYRTLRATMTWLIGLGERMVEKPE